MQQFLSEMEQSEAEQFLGRMTIKAGEAVPLEGLGTPEKRAESFKKTIDAMEAEYLNLLDRLNNMFEITLEIKPVDPFIGQEATVKGAPKFPATQPKPNLGTHGFPDYVDKFRWSIRDTGGAQIGDSLETDKAEFNAVFKKLGMHIVKLEALDKGGNAVASESVSAVPKAITLSGSVGLADGD